MSSRGPRIIAAALIILSGLLALLSATWLTADAVATQRQLARDEVVVDELLERGARDAAYAEPLHAEYERQTDVSLDRDRRVVRLSWLLLGAAAAFLIGVKWLHTLRPPRIKPPQRVVDAHAAWIVPSPELPTPAVQRLPLLDSVDLAPVQEIVSGASSGPEAAIPILHAVQEHYRYLPVAALRRVCEATDISPAQLAGVASFYTEFRRTPIGKHVVRVCHGTACHVAGAPRITDELRRRLDIPPGEDTDAQQNVTVQHVPCLGCCTLAPVVQIDGVTHGHERSDTAVELAQAALNSNAAAVQTRTIAPRADAPLAGEIRIGLGSCCVAGGSARVHDALEEALASGGVNAVVKRVGCVGMCHQTPFVEVDTPERPTALYSGVQPEHAAAIVRRHFKSNGITRRLRSAWATTLECLGADDPRRAAAQRAVELRDPPIAAFLGPQKHIATEHYGDLDPLDLDEYLAHDGFQALELCRRESGVRCKRVQAPRGARSAGPSTPAGSEPVPICNGLLSPEQVIERIRHSGLRGRGGAGFPTWKKWDVVRAATAHCRSRLGSDGTAHSRSRFGSGGAPAYLICNGDEGDPGAFMDRMLMESYPYRVIEGLAIAAHATGATEGYFYIRHEYPLAVERISTAIRRCEERGLLGDLRLHVFQGAGAFVCGEETALIASIEGRRGTPTLRPPYPAQRGLWGRPTLVNNVETCAVVPWILRNGPQAFAAVGTATSKGTKVFALTGKIERGGLIEVPMGVTIREIVEQIGGGIRDGRRFKAVQIGGPSGGCIPAELADTPVDYEALEKVGAMLGSGGLVVLDDSDCMVDIARYFLSFTQQQSCGQCVPCRIGTRRMLEILERLCAGEGRPDELDELEHLAHMVRKGSLCGLGQTAPNPVLTTLRYYRPEYEAHLAGRCPAGRCKALITYRVTDACTGCTLCAQHCPADAIALRPYEQHEIDADKCTRCDTCRTWCPEDAIEVD